MGVWSIALVSAAVAPLLAAGDLQVWNTTEFTAVRTRRWKVEGSGVVRTRDWMASAYDRRVTALVRYSVGRRLSLGGGVLRRWVNPDGNGAIHHHRIFFGPTVAIPIRPVVLESVTLAERHAVSTEPAFLRYRQRIEIQAPRGHWTPFVFEEIVFRNGDGVLRTRAMAGIRRALQHGRRIEFGYQFESIKSAGSWIPRHSIRTAVSLGTIFARDK